jgi:hypothetical protein
LNVVEESESISSRELSSSQDASDVASTSSHSYNAAASCVQKYHETLRQLLVESENEETADGGGEQSSFNFASSSHESFSPTNKRLGEKLSLLTENEFLPENPSQEPEKSADDLGYRRLLITPKPKDNSSGGKSSTTTQEPSELPTGLIDYCLIFGK